MSLLVVKGNIVAALPMKGWYVCITTCSLMCSYVLATYKCRSIPLIEKQL